MTHEIKKEFNEMFNFWMISCPDGWKITSWKEGDDINKYASFEIAYCPKDADLSVYHCVSVEDDAILIEKQAEAFKKEEEERMKSKKDGVIEITAEYSYLSYLYIYFKDRQSEMVAFSCLSQLLVAFT